ncbi:methyltransferase domain-containing protein [Paracoccus liaowanqingii]|uniref:Methyltransferase domain-containing protein n=1 Tax=Paracoccus liaowanqingii TaxID=2560053 RepID=A0A4Z1CRY7_9RHOB|nr:methyltransferase domain-containing protein [Paracoccus liaowanqingii]TGN67910.1 methyltransferase domain-containing protein [Paracoccus liaowanqingii]
MRIGSAQDFSRRSQAPELMDGESDYETFRGCLTDLARVNRLTLAYRPTLAFLDAIHRQDLFPKDRPLHVLDVGYGHGDMLRAVAGWARRRKVAVTLTGIDLNPWSAKAATEATPAGIPVTWQTGDVFALPPHEPIDISLSALVAHHFSDEMLVRFLRWQDETARIGWFINDLHRHPVPYHVFRQASRLLRLHPFVQHDGPVSIARGFVRGDWQNSLAAAGVEGADIGWWVPFRLCVSRVKPR